MATVIDSLVIELGLDPANFTKGQKEAAQAFLKTRDQAVSTGKTIEDSSKKAADSIARIAKEALTLYAVFLGARGIKEFVADITTADAALGRFSRNLNESPQTIAAWGNAAERMGGSADATAGSFERIGKSLYDLHRNGAMLPKEFSQLQALTGKRIDTEHGVDKFLRDTAGALKAMNAIDPAQAHFLAQGMGIDDGTANMMIKYGNAIGGYIDQLKKLSPSDDAIKAAQQLQEKWATLQQTAVSLANTILGTLGPEIASLLTQMTNWVDKNQDWIKSGIVDGVQHFAEYLKSIDWNAVGAGLKDFGNDARSVVDAIGGITTATELLFALWAGSKAISMVAGLRNLLAGGTAAATTASGATETAAVGGTSLLARFMGWGAGALGMSAALTLGGHGEVGAGLPDGYVKKKMADDAAYYKDKAFREANQPKLPYGSLARDPGAHGSALDGDITADGRPVNKSNPLPVTIADKPSSSGGFWNTVGTAIGNLFGVSPAGATPNPGSGLSGIANHPATGTPSLTGSNADVVAYIRQKAIEKGIDPNVALRVAGHEGLRGFDPTKPDGGGDGHSSFGPFQLHYGGINPAMPHGGLGDEFTKATGLDARNSSTWKQQVDFALDQVRKQGWSPWMGARAEGITGKYGVGPLPSGARMSATMGSLGANDNSSSSNVETNINGPITIHTAATDANGIANGISGALKRSTAAATANHGPH